VTLGTETQCITPKVHHVPYATLFSFLTKSEGNQEKIPLICGALLSGFSPSWEVKESLISKV
jgi:hypothetical protein